MGHVRDRRTVDLCSNMLILVMFTFFTWSLNEVSLNGSNFMSHKDAVALDDEGVRRAIWGSKCTLILEMFTLVILWGVKGCLCLMYYRLTQKLGKLHIAVKFIAGYCVVAYILVNVLYLGYWCQPISGYWAVPVVHRQCASYYHHMIFATAWNISADLMLLAIPFFIIPRLQLPLVRKLMIMGVLCLGVFDIMAAVMNRYYNFSHPNSVVYLRWYAGEVGTAIYVVNIPACRPLLRRILQKAGFTATETRSSDLRYNSDPQYGSKHHSRRFHAGFSSSDKKPTVADDEVHLADMRHDRWTFQGPQYGQGPQRQSSWRSENEEEQVVPEGAIRKTMKVMQHRE
ncbi:uncharacterized protein LTR77_010899 [Saxophila tyrrhenica]|uniref:Rhodopsin domain-containing protein n=1 Tax=Saxophila tyrrhenica TaxID=1690608 RepID=A0AAV9NWK1_9PEZI|nr:hypothetical protein LTR77_010899 [Saxophila tyrrhenica]